jgi:restriction endonuclease S subunit
LSGPFDETRYRGLLEGLDITELRLSDVLEDNEKFRIDSSYFSKEAVRIQKLVEQLSCGCVSLGDASSRFVKGIFDIKADTYCESGIPFVRISNLRNGLVDDSNIVYIKTEAHLLESKTALKSGDIVLSKTAYPAASLITLQECNVSQDTIAVKLSRDWKNKLSSGYVVAYLSSAQGLALMQRYFQGNVQMHLSLSDGRKIPIPLFGENLQANVHNCFIAAQKKLEDSRAIYAQAETTLLAEFGLLGWQPPESLSYQRKASEAFAAGRLDAEYFSPRVQHLIALLEKHGEKVGDVAELRREYFSPWPQRNFEYIEIGDVGSDGTVSSSTVWSGEAASRATWHVRTGDILTSTVRPVRRLSAIIKPEQNGFVCSSGFAVLKPVSIAPEVLLVYLRLPPIAQLMDLHTTASLYPAISVPDILALPFARPSETTEKLIVEAIHNAHGAKQKAGELLDRAKRAVEIAIETGESAALDYLRSVNRQKNPT